MHNASQILEQSRFGWISDDASNEFQILHSAARFALASQIFKNICDKARISRAVRTSLISDDANDKFQILQQTPVSRILSSAKRLSPKSSVSNGAKPKLTLNLTASGKSVNLQTGAKFC